jgi:Tol biopolymer transport system component
MWDVFSLMSSVAKRMAAIAVLAASCTTSSTEAPVASSPTAPSTPPPAGIHWPREAIVFAASDGDHLGSRTGVMAVPAGGGDPIAIPVPGPATYAGQVAWSPDGSRQAFIAGRAHHVHAYAGDGDLFVMRADGTHVRRLTSGSSISSPSWSPSGSKIVVVRKQGTELVAVDASSGHTHVIGSRRGYYQAPAWSPDGRWIAVQSAPMGSADVESLYLVHPHGSDFHQISGSTLSEGMPAWSPNGDRIAYREGERLWLMNADGTNRAQLTHCHLPCVADFSPAWAPDGRHIAFTRQEDGGGATRIYVVDLRTNQVNGLTPMLRHASAPSWRP